MPADWVFVDIELHPVARALIIGGLLPAAAGIAFAAAQFLVNRMSGRRP